MKHAARAEFANAAPIPERLYLDTETFSTVPLRYGAHAYAEAAEIMIATWAEDDGPVHTEDYTDGDLPSDRLWELLTDPRVEVVLQNSHFDRTVIAHAWGYQLDVRRVHDTMVRAMAHSLPGSLDKQCEIMGVPLDLAKHKSGKALIRLFCVPQPKNFKIRRATKYTHPEKWAEFLDYAGSDILAMREMYKRLPNWNYRDTNDGHRELSLWRLDQDINDRGFQADVELAESALRAADLENAELKRQVAQETGGLVTSATKRDEMLAYLLVEHGVELPDMKKDTLERRLADPEIPDAVKQLIQIRLAATTTSTAKYKAVVRSVSADGRLRNTLAFVGALRTGRWSGRLFQPQNLPRPMLKQPMIEAVIAAAKAGCLDLIDCEIMAGLRDALRGMIIAAEGRKIVSSDLKNIEGRVAAWLAGEDWKLEAFAEIDGDPSLPDMYCRAYAQSFNVSPESVMFDYKAGGEQRQVGKVQELALGYEGGVGAFLSFAAVYRLDLEDMARRAYATLPEAVRTQAEIMLDWRKRKRLTTYGLSDKAFVVCESFKALWRKAHPAISTYWKELDDAAKEAVRNPGRAVYARKLKFIRKGAWLRMILPSGRALCYPAPQIKSVKGKETLSYKGVNQYTRKWTRISTYGGKLFENACQAVARDVMAHNMPAIEAAGFRIILTVHDDVITEPLDKAELTSDYLSSLLATNPPWMPGCPLAADGFEAQRYRK